VLTTGTFLRGLLHIGMNKNEGGRLGDFSARTLSASLEAAGIELRRFKTGTPARVLGRSLDFSKMEEQKGDAAPTLFAFHDTRDPEGMFHVEHANGHQRLGWAPGTDQLSCWMTYTTERSREIVLSNKHTSAMYSGQIKGVGPRYCPSIEDKFVRFADKLRHLLFLEPEGRHTDEYYINGLSTSMPFHVQIELIHSIPGLENAVVVRPAYAVEYDFAPPTQLWPSLESRIVEGLFCAGQINGTSGYEEAAGQGAVAGINAAQKVRGSEPLVLGRHEAYIGVLIDDLVTKGTNEPYRMFTSRAEHRLLLNHGSAELRLLPHLRRLPGLVEAGRLERIERKAERVGYWRTQLEETRSQGLTFGDHIRREGDEPELPTEFRQEPASVRDEVLYRVRYRGYLEREVRIIERLAGLERVKVPPELDFLAIRGLRKECALKLTAQRPATLGQASRISGVSPADLSVLLVLIESGRAGDRGEQTPPPAT